MLVNPRPPGHAINHSAMALRAFHFNPSLGGFGNESRRDDAALPSSEQTRGSAGAFAQIVKELVDNAVDACAAEEKFKKGTGKLDESPSKHVYKRVRVRIESEEFIPSTTGGDAKMDCLRITVSDNGVGMKDIDACVMVFSSNKNGTDEAIDGESKCKTGAVSNGDKSTKKSKSKKQRKSSSKSKTTNSKPTDGYTSGRYGLGLTLCLLHAQHLVPGSVTCITSATSSCSHWTRGTYSVDMEADRVLCEKREEIEKGGGEDCGTIVSLLVPVSLLTACFIVYFAVV